MDTHTRPGARLLCVAVLALTGATLIVAPPARAQQQDQAAGSDSSAVARLEQTAGHLEQMLRTLRQNPSLEERWTDESVLADAVAAARHGSRAASALARLDAALDSLQRDAGGEGSGELADQLGRISAETDRMRSALRAVAFEMAALRSVVHGEGAGAHPHPGSDTVTHAGGTGHTHGGLHFAHPLATESVSPDTKLRLNFDHRNLPAGELENATALAAEWSPHRSFSIQASVPYSLSAEATGFTHLALKFANYAFEDAGVSVGYGLSVSAPTSGAAVQEEGHTHDEGGHEHGSAALASVRGGTPGARANGTGGVHGSLGKDLWTFEPFLNVGWRTGRWELVGFGTFGIPTNQGSGTEVSTEFSYNASALFRAAPEVQTTLELHGHTGLSGHDADRSVLNLTPGVKLRPSGDSPWFLGLAGSFPVSGDVSYDARALVSLFYHFH